MQSGASRRQFLGAVVGGSMVGLAGCSQSSSQPTETGGTVTGTSETTQAGAAPNTVALETLATGFDAPLDVEFAPNTDRRYVADQGGRVFVHDDDGLRDQPFLDLRETVVSGSETGLLGIALHPDFAENRRVFVRYSASPRSGTPSNYSHTFVLAEFEASEDGTRAKRDSERTVLTIPEPQGNHNAGSLLFGPDGYLYVGVGDGGSGGDQGTGHVDDWYDRVSGGNGQDVTENLLGSVLRIDVNNREDGKGYAVPEDNPLVGSEGLAEHYAWGFRNPWRMSFDNGDFFVADVGQSAYEEVSLVEHGGNYGWNVKEGTNCYSADECPNSTPSSVRGGEPLRDPIVEYPHDGTAVSGISVIGGYVYRGSDLPGLEGTYVFGDYAAGGRLFTATRPDDGDGLWNTRVLEVADGDASKVQRILSFGRDASGELYVLGTGNDGGGLHRIVPA
ncbi:PQQ-dependent sugar dehydrogenase [Halorussus halophilus]|uniref:PQQ-dependent sugar dehydrogenase n=1 Tax=Halorussus halophilus TaxID=2650975 RepID=UPI001301476B|nr:PQQ-dependent sugar dehydrogenase [Halorussus halophilus]